MIYPPKEYTHMTEAELKKWAYRAAADYTTAAAKLPAEQLFFNIDAAFKYAAELQTKANTETDREEAEALSREASAVRVTLNMLYHT